MSKNTYQQLNLSVDEIGMLFSLMNEPELGKAVLLQAFGEIEAEVLDEKLITASHSLLARGITSITSKNTIQVQEGIEALLSPMVIFDDILQVTINTHQPEGPEIINIFLGKDACFTVLRIHLGVVYQLTYAKTSHLPELVDSWLNLPDTDAFETSIKESGLEISMPVLAELDSTSLIDGVNLLKDQGFDITLAEALVQDSQNPQKRGSVILTNMSSEDYQDKNLEQAGAGFLYLQGERTSWLFAFEEAHDTTTAKVLPGSAPAAREQLAALLTK